VAALVACGLGLVMLVPAALCMSVLGAYLATWAARRLDRPERQSHMAVLFALAPFIVTPIESQVPLVDSVRVVSVRQPIRADAATVWYQITHFEPVAAHEHRPSASTCWSCRSRSRRR
jgi:hypothetical protein